MAIEPSAYIHPHAIVEQGATIGARTKVWAFTHILAGAVIGEDCNVNDHVFIENDVVVGNRVTIKSGVQLWNGLNIEDDVFVGPNVTFTNDPFPRSKHYLDSHPKTNVRRGASIGANATILPGLKIGTDAMVGAGAVVTKDVPPNAIVVGNPAFIKNYVNVKLQFTGDQKSKDAEIADFTVRGVKLHRLTHVTDLRGILTFGEIGNGLPFIPQRYFIQHDVPSREIRGEHAHRELHQFLVCVHGEVAVVVDDGIHREQVRLSHISAGIHIEPLVWTILYNYSNEAVLLVFASLPYDSEDYIRDYDEFKKLASLARPHN